MTILKWMVGIVVLFIGIVIISAFLSLGHAANHDQNTSDRVGTLYSQVHVGMTEQQVRSILGKPDSVDTSESTDFEGGTTTTDSWSYGTLADTSYFFTFTDGKLDFKDKL